MKDFPWFKFYPALVEKEVDCNAYSSVNDLFEESVKKFSSSVAYECMGKTLSFSELDRLSAHFANYLTQELKLAKGSRVAIQMPNVLQYPVVMFGALRAGMVVVNTNPLYTPSEMKHQFNDSGADVVVIVANFASNLEKIRTEIQAKHIITTELGDLLGGLKGMIVNLVVKHVKKMVPAYNLPQAVPLKKALAAGNGVAYPKPSPTLDDVALLQYTGGTTGLSKGAVLTHRNIVAAMLQAEGWFSPALASVGDLRKVNSIAALPLYHIFALTLCLLAIRQGSSLTLIPNPRDIPKFVAELKKRPFHMLPAVNTLFNALLQNPQFKALDFSHLCVSQAGGMAASEGTAKQWQKVTGSTMIEGWGMSETCAIGTNNPVISTTFSGNIGLPLPGIDIAIKDDEGNSLPQGESGEICIRGPNVMVGYYNQPEENAKAFTPDGFMRTGDIGIMDPQGYTRIIDRKKDMILVSGFNVFPNELEQVISLCPGVVECAAIGVPDEKQGEAIKVFIIKNDPALTEDEVANYCHQNLTGYKRPKYIEFRDELPKSNVGKILRRELRKA